MKPCTDKTAFPYSCEVSGCTFDRIAKVRSIIEQFVCNQEFYFFINIREPAIAGVSFLMGVELSCPVMVDHVFTVDQVCNIQMFYSD